MGHASFIEPSQPPFHNCLFAVVINPYSPVCQFRLAVLPSSINDEPTIHAGGSRSCRSSRARSVGQARPVDLLGAKALGVVEVELTTLRSLRRPRVDLHASWLDYMEVQVGICVPGQRKLGIPNLDGNPIDDLITSAELERTDSRSVGRSFVSLSAGLGGNRSKYRFDSETTENRNRVNDRLDVVLVLYIEHGSTYLDDVCINKDGINMSHSPNVAADVECQVRFQVLGSALLDQGIGIALVGRLEFQEVDHLPYTRLLFNGSMDQHCLIARRDPTGYCHRISV